MSLLAIFVIVFKSSWNMSPLAIVAVLIFVGIVSYKYLIQKPPNFPNGQFQYFQLVSSMSQKTSF